MDEAAANGHLQVVKWLHENRGDGCTTQAMDCAAANGHLDTIQWLHSNRTEGCSKDAPIWAAEVGHFEVKWLLMNRSEGNPVEVVEKAGHLRIPVEFPRWVLARFPHATPITVDLKPDAVSLPSGMITRKTPTYSWSGLRNGIYPEVEH
ncbi:hypothetical protein F441_19917 [Phytophthora nicotianae CJ01A1]|uniref:Uncharacterized protein n=5 Tax=Phytophthora nicotianae TaxID=4792 RepID=W2PK43_PHYN3|nr:hypothetical protein PPTG_17832 [Phytophthora nicotianae INRA-310]ETI33260.1 hypothetical protein F443_20043 [Phytophthora nicotianae P1569]ETK73595.1 hypothetical protein L915_19494 [Phytophthora nicotianae]ETP03090.1 hypothetical protein F441_19917 [Phytophthora nicotianae CJ01A1]ETP31250.1 hypothetical protein F442_19857 [Phytophthora nicotianae P10297]ETL27027.1 hypothetical protein L916_19387 [Phytophthora nicotianae]